MKKSEMISILDRLIKNGIESPEQLLKDISVYMEPPSIPVRKVSSPDNPWGIMCSMRCNCAACNPDFLVNRWEPEDQEGI